MFETIAHSPALAVLGAQNQQQRLRVLVVACSSTAFGLGCISTFSCLYQSQILFHIMSIAYFEKNESKQNIQIKKIEKYFKSQSLCWVFLHQEESCSLAGALAGLGTFI